ncbi:MAG: hypothetical protein AAGE84_12725 [Cyanobacteria bacterium P01_G01_bin.39]
MSLYQSTEMELSPIRLCAAGYIINSLSSIDLLGINNKYQLRTTNKAIKIEATKPKTVANVINNAIAYLSSFDFSAIVF